MAEKSELNISVEVPEEKPKKVSKKVETTSEKVVAPAKTTKVVVATKDNCSFMYGDRWYYFKKDEQVEVPAEVKEYLRSQNALAVL